MIAIFGGTFDPVHCGHLRLAQEMGTLLDAKTVLFIPAGNPPHRGPCLADVGQRVAMLQCALAPNPRFSLDLREARKTTPSYAVETLTELRAEYGVAPLALLLGLDAFLALERWHRWRELFNLAHIVVAYRPGFAEDWKTKLGPELCAEVDARHIHDALQLKNAPAGCILLHNITALDISASAIRNMVQHGISPRYLLPDSVIDYIQDNGLYLTNPPGVLHTMSKTE